MAEDREEAERAAERRRLVEEARRIDARYKDTPIRWDGPLDTDAEIAAASVAMQRSSEIQLGYRRIALPAAVRNAVRKVARETDALRIILFGSRARGDFREDSDWDICIVLPDDVADGRFTPETLQPIVSGLSEAVQVVPVRRAWFDAAKADPASIAHEIDLDGIVLYDRVEDDDLRRRALDVLAKVPRVPPDEGDEMPD